MDSFQIKKPATASEGRNLSPFTWTNLKLPAVNFKTKPQKQIINQKNQQKNAITQNKFHTIDLLPKQQNLQIQTKKKKSKLNQTKTNMILPETFRTKKDQQKQTVSLHEKVLRQFQRRKLLQEQKINKINKSLSQRQKQYKNLKTQNKIPTIIMQEVHTHNSVQMKRKQKKNQNKVQIQQQERMHQITKNKIFDYENNRINYSGQNRYNNLQQKGNITNQNIRNKRNLQIQSLNNKNSPYEPISYQNNPYQTSKNTQGFQKYLFNAAFSRTSRGFNTKQQGIRHTINASITKLNQSINLSESIAIKSPTNNYTSLKNIKDNVYNQMQPYLKKYFLNNSKNESKMKIFVTSNPKYIPLHQTQSNSSAFSSNSPRLIHQNLNLQDEQSAMQLQMMKNHKKQKPFWLIWTKNPLKNIFMQKSKKQYYNHVQGAHVLTSKQKLNQILGMGCKQFYPVSFSLPTQYTQFVSQYDMILIKSVLKCIINKIEKSGSYADIVSSSDSTSYSQNIQKNLLIKRRSPSVCLGQIIQDLIHQTQNQQQLKLLKLCLILQNYRKKIKLNNYFQKINTYRQIEINIPENMFIDVIQWCLKIYNVFKQNKSSKQVSSNKQNQSKLLNFDNVDVRLIKLLNSYDNLFQSQLPQYLYRNQQKNMWIVKPFASSKAAGISLLNQSQDFYTTYDYIYKQMRYKSKFNNKILMKYIQNPLLINYCGKNYWLEKTIKQIEKKKLKSHGQRSAKVDASGNLNENNLNDQNSKELQNKKQQKVQQPTQNHLKLKISHFMSLQQRFAQRKFDIRQWIIIVCQQNESSAIKQTIRQISPRYKKSSQRSHNQTANKNFKLYKYHTAYCRFARKQYAVDSNDLQIHLTNYQLYKNKQDDRKSPLLFNKQYKQKTQNSNIKLNKINSARSNQDQTQQEDSIKKNKSKQKGSSNKRVSPSKGKKKSQLQSVLMLQQMFEYFQFSFAAQQTSLLQKVSRSNKIYSQNMSLSQYYSAQLDHILQRVFISTQPYLNHNTKTFQLFGVDLILDEHFNLYLEQINLSPGCAAQRSQKLQKQVNVMLDELFNNVLCKSPAKDSQKLKNQIKISQNSKINSLQGNNKQVGEQKLQAQKWVLVSSSNDKIKRKK